MVDYWKKRWNEMKFNTIIDNEILEIEYCDSNQQFVIKNDNININSIKLTKSSFSIIINGQSHYVSIIPINGGYEVTVDHYTNFVLIRDEVDMLIEKLGIKTNTTDLSGEICAQIPGLVSQVFVKEGDCVKSNDKLFILEAMKMENEIISPIEGTIKKIYIDVGKSVNKDDIIMEIIK